MNSILIVNPKGGAGKTTLSTNLAGCLANRGESVSLWDLDMQKSSERWLASRPAQLPKIQRRGIKVDAANGRVVLDSPAGLNGVKLSELIKIVSRIIVPIVPSSFDFAVTRDFLKVLMKEKDVRQNKAFVAIVGMRIDPRTRAAQKLDEFLEPINLPVLTHLRDTQNYVSAAFEGKSIFDMPQWQVQQDIEQWKPIIRWLND
jgi:chromosome partitioning protein